MGCLCKCPFVWNVLVYCACFFSLLWKNSKLSEFYAYLSPVAPVCLPWWAMYINSQSGDTAEYLRYFLLYWCSNPRPWDREPGTLPLSYAKHQKSLNMRALYYYIIIEDHADELNKVHTPGSYFIKVKIFLKSGFKMHWSSNVSANSLSFSSS